MIWYELTIYYNGKQPKDNQYEKTNGKLTKNVCLVCIINLIRRLFGKILSGFFDCLSSSSSVSTGVRIVFCFVVFWQYLWELSFVFSIDENDSDVYLLVCLVVLWMKFIFSVFFQEKFPRNMTFYNLYSNMMHRERERFTFKLNFQIFKNLIIEKNFPKVTRKVSLELAKKSFVLHSCKKKK